MVPTDPNRTPLIYRNMDQAKLDAAYNNSRAVSDSQDRLDRWNLSSAMVRAAQNAQLDIAYGQQPRARLDYFSADGDKCPLNVFVHGGYWQRNTKETFAFVSQGPCSKGVDVAIVGYTLAPEASLSQIVDEIWQALAFLTENANRFGFDPEAIVISGWSAGGHLAALAARHEAVGASLAISGIFDLQPIALSYLNEKLRLKDEEIAQFSPLHTLAPDMSPLHLAVGASELSELRRQSEAYAETAQAQNCPVSLAVLPDHDHYSILDELADPDGKLTRHIVRVADDIRS